MTSSGGHHFCQGGMAGPYSVPQTPDMPSKPLEHGAGHLGPTTAGSNTAADARQFDTVLSLCSLGCPTTIPTAIGTAQSAAPPLPRLVLESNVSRYLAQAAPSTLQAYQSGQRRFLQFCTDAKLQPLLVT
jgi:hypothetical protein